MVAVPNTQDSALIRLMLECDSANNALITELETVKTTTAETAFKQILNTVEVRFKTIRDTVYFAVTDTIIQEPVVVEVEVTKEVNRLRWWQTGLIYFGGFFVIIIIILTIIKFK